MKMYIDGDLAVYDPRVGWVCKDEITRTQLRLYTALFKHSDGEWDPIPDDIDADLMERVKEKMISLGYTVS